MVWALLPVDTSSGEEEKYYIFRKGTYKVGRKGCDITIHNDKGVSRIHAEIIVDDMTKSKSSQVRIRDLSKYGTLVNKNLASKKKVNELPNKEMPLEDGDLLSFGTGNSTYRFCYIPLIFYICCAEASQKNHHLLKKVSSIGASLTRVFGQECTHVLVDKQMSLKADLVDAIVARKPVLHCSWLEFVAEKSIATELPACSSHVPTVMVDGVSVEVLDPKTREDCLKGYTFLLESTHMYNYGDKLKLLLEVSGARSFWVKDFCSNSQASVCGGNGRLTYVIPGRSQNKFDDLHQLGLSYRVNEMALICAILSGNLDQSVLISSSVLVSSSSTDETVVADSDEDETSKPVDSDASTHKEGVGIHENKSGIIMEEANHVNRAEESTCRSRLGDSQSQVAFKDDNGCLTAKRNKAEESEDGNSDIIYSQILVVRDVNTPAMVNYRADDRVVNYKRFRKASIQSGNSFNNLVPFSKYPYKALGADDLAESAKEKRKRKLLQRSTEKVRIVTFLFRISSDDTYSLIRLDNGREGSMVYLVRFIG